MRNSAAATYPVGRILEHIRASILVRLSIHVPVWRVDRLIEKERMAGQPVDTREANPFQNGQGCAFYG